MKEYKNRSVHKLGKYVKAVALPAEWLNYHEANGNTINKVNLEVYENKIIIKPIMKKIKKRKFS
jgi:hypothetical protein